MQPTLQAKDLPLAKKHFEKSKITIFIIKKRISF